MKDFLKEIFNGLIAMDRGSCDEISIEKEGEDRTFKFWANAEAAILTTKGDWGMCNSCHNWSSADRVKEATRFCKTSICLIGLPVDVDRIVQEVLASEAIEDFQLEMTE